MSIRPPISRVKPSRPKKSSLSYPNLDSNNKDVYTNILLIDSRVTDFQKIVDSVNSNTLPIVYLTNASKPELMTLLQNNFTSISRIGIVFYSSSQNTQFLDNKPFFIANETTPYSENIQFILDIIHQFNIKNIDYLACNTLNDPNWVNYYNILTTNTGVTIGASNDKTGNIKYGGDWVMETTSQDVELIYFTSSIEYYTYLLDTISIISSDGSYTITYTVTSGTTLAVVDIHNNIYPDNISVTIPYNVTYNAINYTVPEIGNTNGDPVTSYYPESIINLTLSTGLVIVYDYAFTDYNGSTSGQYLILSSLIIPNTVTNLGEASFSYCLVQSPPANLTIPASVNVLGRICFDSCILDTVTFLSNTTEININNTVQLQDTTPFSNVSINNIILPSGIQTYPNILNGILYNSSSYTIPLSITTIGYISFYGWTGIGYGPVNIILPNSLINIGNYAFSYAVLNKIPTFPSTLQTIGNQAFKGTTVDTDNSIFDIPASVTSIGIEAFDSIFKYTNYNYTITFLNIRTLPTIGTNAFAGNSAAATEIIKYYSSVQNSSNLTNGTIGLSATLEVLTTRYTDSQNINYILYSNDTATIVGYTGTSPDITIPTNIVYQTYSYTVTDISNNAFLNITSLVSVIIPTSVTIIGTSAFSGCTNLSSVTFLKTPLLPTIGINAFSSNASGRNVYYYSTVTNSSVLTTGGTGINSGDLIIMYTSSNISYYLYTNNTAKIYGYSGTPTTITIPTSVTVDSVTYNVTIIVNNAFLNCTSLLSVSIPSSVTSIGDSAFSGATSLASVTFLQTSLLPTIGINAFSSNASVRKAYCYSSITNISVLTNSTGVNFSDLVIINTSSNINYSLNDTNNTATVYGYNGTPTTITIPTSITFNTVSYSVTNIGNNAFLNYTSLSSVSIPTSVTTIGTSAFSGCSSLSSVTFLNYFTIPTIGSNAFQNISISSTGYYYTTVTNSAILTGIFTTLTPVTTIYTDSSQNIIYSLYSNNTATVYGYNGTPTTITIPTNVSFGSYTYTVTNVGNSAFLNCISLLNIYIPSSVISIGTSAFSGANSLTTITFPNTLTSIGSSAFSGCSALSSSIII